MNPIATTWDEEPAYLPAAGEDVFAIMTRPVASPRGVGVVLLQGGSWIPAPGRNQMWVNAARHLAGNGFHVVRMDYHGVGESSGHIDNYRLDEPFVDDVVAAVDWLRRDGAERVVLAGTCFGARTALAVAGTAEGVSGVACFPLPIRDFEMGQQFVTYPWSWYLRRALRLQALKKFLSADQRREYWRSFMKKVRHDYAQPREASQGSNGKTWLLGASFRDDLEALFRSDVSLFLLYGDEDLFGEDFERAAAGPICDLLEQHRSLVEVKTIEGQLHGFAATELQEVVVHELERWMGAVFDLQVERAE